MEFNHHTLRSLTNVLGVDEGAAKKLVVVTPAGTRLEVERWNFNINEDELEIHLAASEDYSVPAMETVSELQEAPKPPAQGYQEPGHKGYTGPGNLTPHQGPYEGNPGPPKLPSGESRPLCTQQCSNPDCVNVCVSPVGHAHPFHSCVMGKPHSSGSSVP